MRFFLATVALMSLACATTTKIVSEPPGATVTSVKDKKELGKTPLTYETKMWIWESEQVTLKAAGKKVKTLELKRSDIDVLPLIGSICLLPVCCSGAVLFAADGFKLPPEVAVKLENEPGAAPTGYNDGVVKPDVLVCMRY